MTYNKPTHCARNHEYVDETPTTSASYAMVASKGSSPYLYRRCLVCRNDDTVAHEKALQRQRARAAKKKKDRDANITTGFYSPIPEIEPEVKRSVGILAAGRVPRDELPTILDMLGVAA